jgi:hypothetical protein
MRTVFVDSFELVEKVFSKIVGILKHEVSEQDHQSWQKLAIRRRLDIPRQVCHQEQFSNVLASNDAADIVDKCRRYRKAKNEKFCCPLWIAFGVVNSFTIEYDYP